MSASVHGMSTEDIIVASGARDGRVIIWMHEVQSNASSHWKPVQIIEVKDLLHFKNSTKDEGDISNRGDVEGANYPVWRVEFSQVGTMLLVSYGDVTNEACRQQTVVLKQTTNGRFVQLLGLDEKGFIGE